jgi:hypothetical protein
MFPLLARSTMQQKVLSATTFAHVRTNLRNRSSRPLRYSMVSEQLAILWIETIRMFGHLIKMSEQRHIKPKPIVGFMVDFHNSIKG